jgi:hypothetical protein
MEEAERAVRLAARASFLRNSRLRLEFQTLRHINETEGL